ncbi:hypothetical protein DS2_15299 [Catenovulum agarivorans DS-2]|uniref:RecA/RadA recombinase n=1 Tax=Catenovulum agarivorans DS-2 TaxID=1328313 RepID=W7QA72_9ALTE|nr:hypothetical protein [Catenovulum agarivorans]EWH08906.1 hypothetical protein DS2_15299 [Catenovulum agarivorans DS-2]
MTSIIESLENKHWLWRGRGQSRQAIGERLPTGYSELDESLQGGFAKTGVHEMFVATGIGELRLCLAACHDSVSVFIQPPGVLNGQLLAYAGISPQQVIVVKVQDHKEMLWAAEQCCKSGACQNVFIWPQMLNLAGRFEVHHIKRLQLACQQGHCRLFILRQDKQPHISLPVEASLSLKAHPKGLQVKINKQKAGWPSPWVVVNMCQQWPELTTVAAQQQAFDNNIIHFPAKASGG